VSRFEEITDALSLPRIIRLSGNLFAASFTLMKLVPARHILRTAAARGELDDDTVIVETTSGTFGLALAMQAALLRRDLVLVSDPVVDPALRRRMTDLGARLEIVTDPAPVGGIQGARLTRLAEVRTEYPRTFCPEQYSNPENPRSYAIVAEHLARALGQVDCVIGPVGSGGSMCGTVRALRSATPHTTAVGVDTHESVLFGQPDGPRGLRGVGNSLVPANLDHTVFDEVHWCGAAEAYAATRELHRAHALFQGPTSGAAYLAARWWAARHPDALCVVMLPDEGYRYQDTVFDDTWLAGNDLVAPVPAGPADITDPTAPTDRWSRLRWGRRTLDEAAAPARVAVP